eukprot:7218849-Prymnesium_polylepis.1
MFSDRQLAVDFVPAETRQAAATGVAVQGVLVRGKGTRQHVRAAFEFARCAREDCPCDASFNGLEGECCSFSCRDGEACESN